MTRNKERVVAVLALYAAAGLLGGIAAALGFNVVREVLSIVAAGLGVFATGLVMLMLAEAASPEAAPETDAGAPVGRVEPPGPGVRCAA